jgi:hypothetical protein
MPVELAFVGDLGNPDLASAPAVLGGGWGRHISLLRLSVPSMRVMIGLVVFAFEVAADLLHPGLIVVQLTNGGISELRWIAFAPRHQLNNQNSRGRSRIAIALRQPQNAAHLLECRCHDLDLFRVERLVPYEGQDHQKCD